MPIVGIDLIVFFMSPWEELSLPLLNMCGDFWFLVLSFLPLSFIPF